MILHFEADNLCRYVLMDKTNPHWKIVEQWPKATYSRQKALARADRAVGLIVRRADPETKFTYTQEIPQ